MERSRLSRRGFLAGTGALAGTLLAAGPAAAAPLDDARALGRLGDPFTLGVASGDPLPDAVVLWTRLAPDPLAAGGGMPDRPVVVRWEVAADEHFRHPVRRGLALARPVFGHSVHVDVRGLRPATPYWYRFRVEAQLSPAGRTRTAPAAGSAAPVSFAFASCAQYEHGFFTAYRYLAEEHVDVVFHLGDYLYEYAPDVYEIEGGNVRDHVGDEMHTLEEYRQRHAQYKTDPDLQAAHASAPWIMTWDDHEVDNNYADEIPEDRDPEEGNATTESFLARRAAAYRAYWENLPLRMPAPRDEDLPLYRRFDFGVTARFSVLDTRQYRTDQPCGDEGPAGCGEEFDPAATILGDEQAAWVEGNLASSTATWNVLPQQIFFANLDQEPGGATPEDPRDGGYSDGWDGYRASRRRLLSFVADRGIDNLVVLTGDIHSSWLADLRLDFEDPASPALGTELVCTSITAGGDGSDQSSFFPLLVTENPHLRYNSNRRGYVRCDLDAGTWTTSYRAVDVVEQPGGALRTDATWVLEAGNPTAEPA